MKKKDAKEVTYEDLADILENLEYEENDSYKGIVFYRGLNRYFITFSKESENNYSIICNKIYGVFEKSENIFCLDLYKSIKAFYFECISSAIDDRFIDVMDNKESILEGKTMRSFLEGFFDSITVKDVSSIMEELIENLINI